MLNDNREVLFRQWLEEQAGTVLKVARAYTLNVEDCHDLAQDILLEVWCSLPQFEGRASPSTWAYRVALNTALGWRRKERRRRAHHQPLLGIDEFSAAGSGTEANGDREVVEQLYAAIRQLPKSDAALVLLYLDNLSYREMAEVLGLSESNVGVKLNRAKKALSELMNEKPHES